jgi:hypothetical protein
VQRLIALLAGLALAIPLSTAAPASAAPTPREGFYSWYQFDCESPCGGAYGTWEVDLHVVPGGKAQFSHVGSRCNADKTAFFDFTEKQGTKKIKKGKVAIKRSFESDGATYTVRAKLSWVTAKKATGWVRATGPDCDSPKKAFTVTAA